MISVSNLSVIFGERALFNDVSFFLSSRDRIGLVGKNGAGKSTLLKIIAELENPTNGTVSKPKDCRVGYLPQQMKHNERATILDEAQSAFKEIKFIEARVKRITEDLGTREDYETDSYSNLIQELNDLNERLHIMEGGNTQEKTERVLKGLGFVQEELNRPMSTFSGGWKMRVELAKILLMMPDVVLLDEPTNHLDIESIDWLEQFLQTYPGSIILISHDRDFLDNITNRTIEISAGKLYDYKFPYSKYLIQREDELEKQKQAYKNQQKYIVETQVLINKFRAKKNKAAFAQSLIKKLDKLEIIQIDDFDSTKINIRFPEPPHSGKVVIEAHELKKSFGVKHIFSGVNFYLTKGEKIALVGKNGVGKTTLLKILTGSEKAEGNFKIGHNVDIGYFAQNEADLLDEKKTVFEIIDEEAVGEIRTQIRAMLGAFLFGGDDIEKKVSVLSGGERTRLALCKLLLKPYNLLILDEPTNHLDLLSKKVLQEALSRYQGTVILVSHDRNFLHGLAKTIYELKKDGVKQFIGDIYEFLKEKRAASIAKFEQSPQFKNNGEKEISDNKVNYQDRKRRDKELKKLQNKIKRCEKEISETEQLISEMDAEIAKIDYSDQIKSKELLEEYQLLKDKLDQLVLEWDEAEENLKVLL